MLSALSGTDCSGDGGDVGIDVGQRPGGEPEKADSGLQNLTHGLLLIGNRSNDQIGFRLQDLRRIRGP